MDYIKIFQNAQAVSVSLRNSYYECHLMHILLDNLRQGGKYTAQIASHQAELIGEGNFADQKTFIYYIST